MYIISNYSGNLKNDSGELIEQNTNNLDYLIFESWIAEGNTPTYVDYFEEEYQKMLFDKNVVMETEKYKQRMLDGQFKYAEISAKFRLLKLTGVITEESQRDIENLFKPVRNEVLAGQWVDAKIQLELLEQLSIDIGKHDLYLEIWNIINSYVLQSYTTYEVEIIQRNARK